MVDYENDRLDEAEKKLLELVESSEDVPPEAYEYLYLINKYDREESEEIAATWNEKFVHRIETLAQQGSDEYRLKLAYMQQFGDRVPQDISSALSTFKLLAEKGIPEAQYHLGTLYSGGKCGLDADDDLYIYWLEKSANSKYPEALYELSMLILSSKSIGQAEQERACSMLREAAEKGSKMAAEYLGTS